jgi:hypothetical protein
MILQGDILTNRDISPNRVRIFWVCPAVAFTAWTAWLLREYLPRSIRPFLNHWRNLLPPNGLAAALIRCVSQPWARDCAAVLVLTLAATCVGGWLLSRLRITPPQIGYLERFIFAAAAGFSTLVILASALALPGLFRPLPLRILLAAFAIVGLLLLPSEWPNLRGLVRTVAGGLRREPFAAVPLAFAAVFCWFALISTAAPETTFDSCTAATFRSTAWCISRWVKCCTTIGCAASSVREC